MSDARRRMQMTGNLSFYTGRPMAERQGTKRNLYLENTANVRGRLRIVITGEPDPLAAALKHGDIFTILPAQSRRTAAIVEVVAECEYAARRVIADQTGKPHQCFRGVVRRHQHAAGGEARSLFQVQISDNEQPVFRPIQRAGGIANKFGAADRHRPANRRGAGASTPTN